MLHWQISMLQKLENHRKFFKLETRNIIVSKLLYVVIPLFFVTFNAWGYAEIKHDQTYVGDDGMFHIVGEIENGFSVPINQINVVGKFYDSSNNIIFTKTTNPLLSTIMPDTKVPFEIMLTKQESKEMVHHSLELDYKMGSIKNQVIDITDSKINQDNYNNLFITGMVENKGEVTANIVSVVATMYDKEGNVAAVSITHPEPDYLRTNDKAFFVIPLQDKNQAESVASYSLIAESDEYTAVPEFPIGSMILLVVSVFSYIIITKYSGKFITNLVCAVNPK